MIDLMFWALIGGAFSAALALSTGISFLVASFIVFTILIVGAIVVRLINEWCSSKITPINFGSKSAIGLSLVSIVIYTVFWLIWLLVMWYCLPVVLNLNWLGIAVLAVAGLMFSAKMDGICIMVDPVLSYLSNKPLVPLFCAWIPSLTLGLWVISLPIRFGIEYNRYDSIGPLSVKQWVVIAIFTLFSGLNLISILRIPFTTKRGLED